MDKTAKELSDEDDNMTPWEMQEDDAHRLAELADPLADDNLDAIGAIRWHVR